MTRPNPPSAPRAVHPTEPALVRDVDLASSSLERRPDAEKTVAFRKMMANAEYWLSFDLASFEPMLTKTPSPLRELGVAILLRYGEDVRGALTTPDLTRAREGLSAELPPDLWSAVDAGIESLMRATDARDRAEALHEAGYLRYRHNGGVAAHALRAMGSATVSIEGVQDGDASPVLPVGRPIGLSASDERGRPLAPPDIESRVKADVLVKDDESSRRVVFLVPGRYQIRVPTKASGARKVLVR